MVVDRGDCGVADLSRLAQNSKELLKGGCGLVA
jgi:hypothetical protein